MPIIETEQDALNVAEKIRYQLNRSFDVAGHHLGISSSTGIAMYPMHGDSETQLMKNADIAMYRAKADGRDNVRVHRSDIQ